MPLIELTAETAPPDTNRVLIFGPPNTFKTTSLLTWPRPTQIISCPGEGGWKTIPMRLPDLKAYVWEDDVVESTSAVSVRQGVEKATWEIIGGKRGPVTTLAIDGYHKLYDVYLDVVTGGKYSAGEEFEARLYGQAHNMAKRYLRRVLQSPIPYVVVTSWNAKEADKPGVMGGPSHEYPDLPGKMAKRVVGEFSVVVFSRVLAPTNPKEGYQGIWLLKPDSEVWGASVKMDPALVDKLPSRIVQDWAVLDAAIKGQLVPSKAA